MEETNDIESNIQLAFVKAEPPFDINLNKDMLKNYFNEHKLNKMLDVIEEFV